MVNQYSTYVTEHFKIVTELLFPTKTSFLRPEFGYIWHFLADILSQVRHKSCIPVYIIIVPRPFVIYCFFDDRFTTQ